MQDQLVFVLDVEELVPLAAGEEARDLALNTLKRACLRSLPQDLFNIFFL